MKLGVIITLLIFLIFSLIICFGDVGFYHFKNEQKVSNIFKAESVEDYRLLFVGDLMFDRTIRKKAEINGEDSIFSCLEKDLKDYDRVVANLEGPITENKSLSLGTLPGDQNNTRFTFPETLGALLKKYNINIVSMGNNHIFDFGKEGVLKTRQVLSENNIDWVGDPLFSSNKSYEFITDNDFRVAIVGFNQFLGVDSVDETLKEIQRLKKNNDFVFVYSHWGDEYVTENNFQIETARKFVDAGADAVFGSHPHVIQSIETYKGKKIYYSLGNFIFDQYFSPEVTRGLVIEVKINNDKKIIFKERNLSLQRDKIACLE